MTAAQQRRLAVLVVCDKGGSGKSQQAKGLYDWYRRDGVSIGGWDFDAANGTFARYDTAIQKEDLLQLDGGTSRWIADLAGSAQVVLGDVPGGHANDFARIAIGGLAALREMITEMRRELVVVTPIGTMATETTAAQAALEAFSGARIVIVKNGFFGDESDFLIFDGDGNGNYGATGEMARNAGADVVYFPRMARRTLAVLDHAKVSLYDAATGAKPVSIEHRIGAKYYLEAVARVFAGTALDLSAEVRP